MLVPATTAPVPAVPRPRVPNWELEAATFLAQKKPNTRQNYALAIRDFFRFAPVEPPEVTEAEVTAWACDMEARGLKPGTISVRLTGLSAFFRHLAKCKSASVDGLLRNNPVANVDRTRWKVPPYGNSRRMAVADLDAMLSYLEAVAAECERPGSVGDIAAAVGQHVPPTKRGHVALREVTAKRDIALLLFFALTGRRRREVLHLNGADFDANAGGVQYHYQNTKSGVAKWRQLPAPVVDAIESYLAAAGRPPLLELDDEEPLWLSHSGKAKGERFVRMDWVLKNRARQAGVDVRRVHVHGLRHLNAGVRKANGETHEEIRAGLDHSSLAVTEVYLPAVVGVEDEKAASRWETLKRLRKNGGGL